MSTIRNDISDLNLSVTVVFEKSVPNKPTNADSGAQHIANVTRLKSRKAVTRSHNSARIDMTELQYDDDGIGNGDELGWPKEHDDELGPGTHRELVAKQ